MSQIKTSALLLLLLLLLPLLLRTALHCTAPPILNNSDLLRVISTDLSPHFMYNLRLDLLLLLRYCIF
jgi:hypothetical protein